MVCVSGGFWQSRSHMGKYHTNTEIKIINIRDRICEKVYSSHIHFFNFGKSQILLRMTNRCEIFRNCSTTIPLSFLKVLTLCTIPCGFYASPNAQNRMCELCTFSQIRFFSHIKGIIIIIIPLM